MSGGLNYPRDAASVRDTIKELIRSQIDHNTSMDTGGGMGQADLWASFGGQEYMITVRSVPNTKG